MKRFFLFVVAAALIFGWNCPLRAGNGEKSIVAILQTDAGDIRLLLSNRTPRHRDNFTKLAKSGFYDGLLFHRVIPGFVIQTGDPDSREAQPGAAYGENGASHKLEPEIMNGMHHIRGMVGAARESDAENPARLSSGSHFYIVQGHGKPVGDEALDRLENRLGYRVDAAVRGCYEKEGGAPHLDGAYTLFGCVIGGMETVDAIASGKTDDHDRPLQDVRIVSVKIKRVKNKKIEQLCNPELKNF